MIYKESATVDLPSHPTTHTITMKEKLKNYFTALQILSQIPVTEAPCQEIWDKGIDLFFGESLASLGLPAGSYHYDDGRVGKNRCRRFTCTNSDENFSVNINVYTDNGDRMISATARFGEQSESINTSEGEWEGCEGRNEPPGH